MMIIAAVRNEQELEVAIAARVKMIFCLNPSILTLEETVRAVHEAGKKIFVEFITEIKFVFIISSISVSVKFSNLVNGSIKPALLIKTSTSILFYTNSL